MQATANKTTGARVIGLEPKTTVSACGVMCFQSDKVAVSKHTIYVSDSRKGVNAPDANAGREFFRQVEANYASSVDDIGLNFVDIVIALPGGKMSIGSHRRVGTTLVMITVVNGPMQVAFFKVNGLKAEKTKIHCLSMRGLTRSQPTSERRDATITTSMLYSWSFT
ncbi:MAG: hypothetical protein ACJA09_000128 [Alcanivorax sp.]|jgi:hypothetical protein